MFTFNRVPLGNPCFKTNAAIFFAISAEKEKSIFDVQNSLKSAHQTINQLQQQIETFNLMKKDLEKKEERIRELVVQIEEKIQGELANKELIPLTPRGAGSGLSGGAIPVYGGIVISLEKMNRIIEIDYKNMMIVLEPGVITNDERKI